MKQLDCTATALTDARLERDCSLHCGLSAALTVSFLFEALISSVVVLQNYYCRSYVVKVPCLCIVCRSYQMTAFVLYSYSLFLKGEDQKPMFCAFFFLPSHEAFYNLTKHDKKIHLEILLLKQLFLIAFNSELNSLFAGLAQVWSSTGMAL